MSPDCGAPSSCTLSSYRTDIATSQRTRTRRVGGSSEARPASASEPAHPERRKLRRRPCAKTDRDGGHDGRGRDLGMDTTEAGRDRVDVARGV